MANATRPKPSGRRLHSPGTNPVAIAKVSWKVERASSNMVGSSATSLRGLTNGCWWGCSASSRPGARIFRAGLGMKTSSMWQVLC